MDEFAKECERLRQRAKAWGVAMRFKQAPVEAEITEADARTIEKMAGIASRAIVENIKEAIAYEVPNFRGRHDRIATTIVRKLTGEGG